MVVYNTQTALILNVRALSPYFVLKVLTPSAFLQFFYYPVCSHQIMSSDVLSALAQQKLDDYISRWSFVLVVD